MINNYYIYKHTSPSNKVYIGITSQKPENRWSNITDIEKELGIAHQSITACCKGRIKTSHNYIWKYDCKNIKEEEVI